MRLVRLAIAVLLATGLLALGAGEALAATTTPPAGGTTSTTFRLEATGTFTEPNYLAQCLPGHPLYDVTETIQVSGHATQRPDGSFEMNVIVQEDSQWVPATDPSLPTYAEKVILPESVEYTGQTLVLSEQINAELHGSDGSLVAAHLSTHVTFNDINVIENPDGTITVAFLRVSGNIVC
jgi:hypothetical protein